MIMWDIISHIRDVGEQSKEFTKIHFDMTDPYSVKYTGTDITKPSNILFNSQD